ncbi:MAG: extracellular solute-binding protein, partial [Hyphomicrobiales bacterium]|nr:extracellular solute-binding protein [Hyphomicrobiales bacterium]
PWLGRMALEQALLPLDEDLRHSSLNPFDFYAAAWEGGRCMGQQMGIPFSPTAELLLFRKDIFESNGLAPPTTFDAVVEAARKVHAPAKGRYGIAWNAARGQPLGQTFIQIMAAFGSPPVNLARYGAGYDLDVPWEKLQPTLDNEAGRATLDYLVELARYSPPSISAMDWSGRTDAYRSGLVAMCYEWSSRTLDLEEDQQSPARGNTGYVPHPTTDGSPGIAPMGGWVLAIPSNIEPGRQRPAWRALQWLVSPEFTKCLIQNGSPAKFLHSVSADPEVADLIPVFTVMDSMEKRGQLQIWPRPPIPFMTSMMRIVGQEVHDVIWGD